MKEEVSPLRDGDLDFTIARSGECRFPSPLSSVRFTRDDERALYHARLEAMKESLAGGRIFQPMETAGPREKLFSTPLLLPAGS